MLFIYNQENSSLVEKYRELVIHLYLLDHVWCWEVNLFNYCVKKREKVD